MSQIRIWGGSYDERATLYILNDNKYNTTELKVVCVVCEKTEFIELDASIIKSRKFETFKVGYENDILCYLNKLESLIHDFFALS
jgi:hypothetical protein